MKTLLLNIWTYFLLAVFTVKNLVKNLFVFIYNYKFFAKKKVAKPEKGSWRKKRYKVKFKTLKYTGLTYPLSKCFKKGYGLKGIEAKTGIAIQTLKDYRNELLEPLKMKLVSKKLARSFYGTNAKEAAPDCKYSLAGQIR